MENKKIAVTTVAFSKNQYLRERLNSYFKHVRFNDFFKRLNQDELKYFLKDVDGAIIGLDEIDEDVLKEAKNLKIISKYGVGLNNIDFSSAKKYQVNVVYSQGVNKRSVSELVLGNILSLMRNSYITSNKLKKHEWDKNGGIQLSGKKIGIIGVGNIGKDLVNLLKPFNCTIYVNDIIQQDEYYTKNSLIKTTKEEIYQKCDVVTVHTPSTELTKNMINKNVFTMMKKEAYFINTARGDIVVQEDLKWALKEKIIAGAAIDVYDQEPPRDYDFISLPNLICTPHIGGNAKEAVLAMGESAIENLVNYFKEN
ncbi:phosphoglycerate dehydrogenase [Campylobacter jejuni]|uniref:phosphoglycerate dehydrogenase n=1 Tax=Campylobacter jejuni TaxID=197 RepID=UPI000FA73715|nr:phosphoglycerate dehydrogenase [Campylobacter jejuni]EAL0161894.1 hydroxyacid dehydrogenase [Campylobacter jejuni]EAL8420002.1 hydroxyacid dehydrogenase [Campylobacter jejuni]EFD5684282.1 phosphoglycerate dehydrogenase [Campylobacter jejuni]EFD8043056.1 phosphoglycerate dehydrogenase [Campylobacter jejuni]EHD2800518.1 phosphoglycerate dehydrogenase [Campylobacter jejuni]